MIKSPFLGKRSVIFTWFLSYALILFIPITFSVITYFQTGDVLEHEISQSNAFILKRVQQYMDSLLVDIGSLGYEIMYNPNVRDILQYEGQLTGEQQISVYHAVKDFKSYKVVNRQIESFFIFFKDLDLVVSDSTSTDCRTYYQRCYTKEEISFSQWSDFVRGSYKGDYLSLPSGNGGKAIVYACSFDTSGKGRSAANMFIMLDESIFLKDAEGFDFANKGSAFIMDRRNKIISSTGNSDYSNLIRYSQLEEENGLSHYKLEGKEVAVSFIKSSVIDWKYVSVIPTGEFWEKLEHIRRLTVVSFLLCLFIGGMASYLCVKRNYKPLDALVSIFKNGKTAKYDTKYNNEFSFIKQAINKTLDENVKINCTLLKQNRGLKSVFLGRLLKGKEGSGVYLHDLLSTYNMHFETDYFMVIVFYIKNLGEIFNEYGESEPVRRTKLIRFVITNVAEELIGLKNQGFMTELDEMMVCLVNFRESDLSTWKTDIYHVVSEIQDFLGSNYNIDFTVAMSNVHETVIGIPQAYSEALQALEYKKVTGKNEIISYEQIDGLPKVDYYYPLESEYRLINCIKAGDFGGVKILLDDIFNMNFEKGSPSIEIVRCLMFNMVSTMLKTLNYIRNICKSDFLEELKPVETLTKCATVSEMKCRILNTAEKVCNYMKEYNQNFDYSIRDKVIEFVEKNYRNQNLSNTTIAEFLGMNPDYVSNIFKRQTGYGLPDYINTTRIRHAKQALKEFSCNLDEIAEKAGYNNTRTFTRLFKKYEGITPGRFREIAKSDLQGLVPKSN